MPTVEGLSIDGLLSTPLVLPAPIAGALAALFVVLGVAALRRHGVAQRLLLPLTMFAVGLFAGALLVDRLALDRMTAEQRALLTRNDELLVAALASDSALSCLDGSAGEFTENACEKAVFADAQSVARAVAYTGARLSLLREAVNLKRESTDAKMLEGFAATRRAIELDRYGLAAHILSTRDGCTFNQCYVFALVGDAGVLKANLKAGLYDQYVARYAMGWKNAGAPSQPPAVGAPATVAPPPVASATASPLASGHPVDSRWDFPSSASIPPVNIMTGEPPPAKGAAAVTQTGASATAQTSSMTKGAAAASAVPVPPKRPQVPTTAAVPAR